MLYYRKLINKSNVRCYKRIKSSKKFWGARNFLADLDRPPGRETGPQAERKANGATRQPFKKWRIE